MRINFETMSKHLRRTLAGILLASLCVFSTAGAAEPSGFMSVLDDMPLMQGLTEDLDAAMVFNSGAGRVIEAAASGEIEPEKITDFYVHTLPQLGWIRRKGQTFVRGGEVLRLEILRDPESSSRSWLKLSLSPSKEQVKE